MPARGFGRFRGAGSLWKTSWRGRVVPLVNMCCIENFEGGQFYVAGADLAPLDFVNGSWFAAVVGINALPTPGVYQGVAMGTLTGLGGWDLAFTSSGPGVLFRLRLNVGSGTEMTFLQTAAVVPDPSLQPLGYEVFYRVFVQALPPTGGAPNGQIAMWVEGIQAVTPGAGGNLVDPYLAPVGADLVVGRVGVGVEEVTSPNCVHGFLAGTSTSALDPLSAGDQTSFFASIEEQFQITVPPGVTSAGDPAVGFAVLNGWRANNPPLPEGDAPNPFLPYVGADVLQYGALLVPNLAVMCEPAAFAQSVLGP